MWLLLFTAIIFSVFITSSSNAQEQIVPLEVNTQPIQESDALIDTPVFKEGSQTSTIVTPTFNDNSTNIAFYMKCPSEACPNDGTLESPVYLFSAENLGHGSLPFSEYWAPPFPSDYIAVEYKNDAQQFSCSGISLDECLADTHFVDIFYFALVDDETEITKELLASKAGLNNPSLPELNTENSTTSAALLLLSITLSSTSISSNLDNGLIVTASLDGIASVSISSVYATDTTTSTQTAISSTTEVKEESSVGSFIIDIIESVIDIFTSEKTAETPLKPVEEAPDESNSSQIPEPEIPLEPTIETTFEDSAPENEVQSSAALEDVTNNEIITTEF